MLASDPTLALAGQLVSRPSITPDDAGCQTIIAERLQAIGFVAERFDRGGVSNLWLRRGSGRPLLCLAGHTDVVPSGPRDEWLSDPFVPQCRNGLLYGRGSADMKGSLAAFVTAIEAFVAARPAHRGSIALLLTADEEGEAIDGTVTVTEALHERGQRIDYCIVGEPTATHRLGDMIKNGRRGSLSGRLTVRGIQGHVAYPHLARNPVHLVAPAITTLATTTWDEGDACFPPTTWQISSIHAGTGAGNVIPGSVVIDFNFRFGTVNTPEALQRRLSTLLDDHRLDHEIVWTLGARPFLTAEGTLVGAARRAIRDELGIETELSTTGGTSDGRFIAAVCDEVVEIGPVNATIHKVNECVEVAALTQLSGIYRRILEQLLTADV
ncbi:succinyl-diaminopimelate desuccinylase [Accumulibacter sp.]|uniref:succinyl-diaminopimelate desuccinylase n=1 Tax=Accumulibacter sp. TaxID=2053492 RepID=UPI002600FED2|nr:succinyl-diaminopimelate desuccinylase [Accumulibacter sp.]MCM8594480.1 succinyl-diaminopimelate desuccinylase [Accumulibacter sp.]MDS4048626.1 succinyl-diaminopimelate desuccinylase [Accumulibacter sp.]